MTELEHIELLDIEKLLAPLDANNGVGENLRYEDLYDEINEYRKEDDPTIPQGVWESELKTADWNSVKKACISALSEQTKDLQIAAWLLESMIHMDGFQGLSEGLYLLYKLASTFWDSIYPPIESDDLEFRLSPMTWTNKALSEKLKSVPITAPVDTQLTAYSFHQWGKIVYLENLAKQSPTAKKRAKSDRTLNRSLFQKSCQSTPDEFFVSNQRYLVQTNTTLTTLEAFLDEKCGKTSPSLSSFRGALEEIITKMDDLVKSPDKPGETEDTTSPLNAGNPLAASVTVSIPGLPTVQNKDDAYQLLSDVAEYLLDLDPHSPVPYLIKRAVSWGEMTLSELLAELLKDGQNLQQVFSLLGIKE